VELVDTNGTEQVNRRHRVRTAGWTIQEQNHPALKGETRPSEMLGMKIGMTRPDADHRAGSNPAPAILFLIKGE